MELTQEQKERIKQNRERALEIQRQRKLLELTSAVDEDKHNINRTSGSSTKHGLDANNDSNESSTKRIRDDKSKVTPNRKVSSDSDVGGVNSDGQHDVMDDSEKYQTDEIEAFEENASEYITKQEAMKVYCLPQGTLDVCRNCITKPNPKHATWSDMKLYLRKEIRYRAHQRYGGMVGLMEERNRRNRARLQRDMEQSKDIFK